MNWFKEEIPHITDSVLTMGNFDGMHLGHQRVLQELIMQSKRLGLKPVVISYIEHPGHFVHFKHQVPILTPRVLKKELFRELGLEHIYFLNFTAESAHTSALDFLKEVIVSCFHPRLIVSGYDTHFGYQREGNSDFLRTHEQLFDYQTIQIDPVYHEQTIISSSAIREMLSKGEIKTANAMLGKPYRLYGSVTHGSQIGKTIGFPTINLSLLDAEQLVPRNGVYLSRIFINGNQHFGLTNIGTSPTLKNSAQIEIETHILDYDSDSYHEQIKLDLLDFLRTESTFSSVEELKDAIRQDIKAGRRLLDTYEKP
jgi:riboflavin kinase/FMN adenylyltransferase